MSEFQLRRLWFLRPRARRSPQVTHGLKDFFVLLPDSEHDAGSDQSSLVARFARGSPALGDEIVPEAAGRSSQGVVMQR
eukprot:763880-Hanusia_phi.AAC.4